MEERVQFNDWFFSLPIWDEIDNYLYFALAGIFLYLSPIDGKEAVGIWGALVGALIMKGRGPSNK